MDDLLAGDSVQQLVAGEVIVGHVLTVRKHEVLIDLGAQGVGFVPRREVGFSRQLKVGDEVTASVVDTELDNGYSLLSLRKAAKDRGWEEVQAKMDAAEKKDKNIKTKIKQETESNKKELNNGKMLQKNKN